MMQAQTRQTHYFDAVSVSNRAKLSKQQSPIKYQLHQIYYLSMILRLLLNFIRRYFFIQHSFLFIDI